MPRSSLSRRRSGLLPLALAATLVVALVTGLAGATSARGSTLTSSSRRAMWVWSQPGASALINTAKAAGVGDLFVWVPDDVANSPRLAWLRSVKAQADGAGIRLQALGAETSWIDDPQAAVTWQRQAMATGLFTGSHIDLEPWLHAEWGTDQAGVLARYLTALTDLAADSTRPVEVDVSFWLWTLTTASGQPVDAAVLDRVDAITIMSYRDTATGEDSILGTGAHELQSAMAAGKPARLAIETHDLGSNPVDAKCTFYGSTKRAATSAMASADKAAAGLTSYAGIAIHDYSGWVALRK